jgi:hypothetical protein
MSRILFKSFVPLCAAKIPYNLLRAWRRRKSESASPIAPVPLLDLQIRPLLTITLSHDASIIRRLFAVIATMDFQEPDAEIPAHAAVALRSLMDLIDDPKANVRIRLEAVQRLKKYLSWLGALVEAQQTASNVRQEIIEVLRSYRRSNP